uniref:Secreted protein n=1 Tax=Arion vulgaris TaxID=1028688 RepID=A0A0B7AGB6_9EUPU
MNSSETTQMMKITTTFIVVVFLVSVLHRHLAQGCNGETGRTTWSQSQSSLRVVLVKTARVFFPLESQVLSHTHLHLVSSKLAASLLYIIQQKHISTIRTCIRIEIVVMFDKGHYQSYTSIDY